MTEPTFYIAVNNNLNSRLLKDEVTRNWIDPNYTKINKEFCESMHLVRCNLRMKIVIVDGYAEFINHKVPLDSPFPVYRIGEYKSWNEFDKECFKEATWQIYFIKYVIDSYYINDEIGLWQKKCDNLKREAREQYIADVLAAYPDTSYDIINQICYDPDEEILDIISRITKEFTDKKLPEYKPPQFPAKPTVLKPWDDSFEYFR